MMDERDIIEVTVHGVTMDPGNNSPIILLKDQEGKRAMPIWIGILEANAIAMNLSGVEPPRPMTHDLVKSLLEVIGAGVDSVAITDLKDNIFYAAIHLKLGGREFSVDSRPSDAIALAVRMGCPIYVKDELFIHSAIDLSSIDEKHNVEDDNLAELLKKSDPKDFSKYKM
ncbi:hypothetical protein BMS3Abin14_01865 [bacterium BMS3Abin14]|nr:hypothetical protein BMS3Abin14_01865 [bacterium BMS3Abin14]